MIWQFPAGLCRRLRRQPAWLMTTSTSMLRIRFLGFTQTRAARSTWCRRSSRARCRASQDWRTRSDFRTITWTLPWTTHSARSFRRWPRCRHCRICSCTFRNRFESNMSTSIDVNFSVEVPFNRAVARDGGRWLCRATIAHKKALMMKYRTATAVAEIETDLCCIVLERCAF